MTFTASQIFELSSPSVANLIALQNNCRIGSGTGFVVDNKLVTCAHVVEIPTDSRLQVKFEKPAPNSSHGWTYDEPLPFEGHSNERYYDYAILRLPTDVRVESSLQFADRSPTPGEPVCTLGYPFEEPHLTIHQGLVSAVYMSGVATMLKLDMSVNPSNSGGPLISLIDGKVIGVVARKATGLTKAFDGLMRSFDQTASVLENSGMRMSGGGIDAIQVLALAQRQMKEVSKELQRSANVGIGYAILNDPLKSDPAFVNS